ncbi:hypothetical protein [Streptomyces sp. NPDC002044]|uniref:hypothetical protein n=1 Tax=Streptomyces sp. NPDC002044 TaxID=3154662 RepID=UPI00331EC8BA
MGGREHTRAGRQVRPVPRRAFLLTALGLLVGALFLCARPGEVSVPGAAPEHGTHAVCTSPYELPGCSPLAHVVPAVLPVPPPAVVLHAGGPPAAPAAAARGLVRPPRALARAPDLHALQVLRT